MPGQLGWVWLNQELLKLDSGVKKRQSITFFGEYLYFRNTKTVNTPGAGDIDSSSSYGHKAKTVNTPGTGDIDTSSYGHTLSSLFLMIKVKRIFIAEKMYVCYFYQIIDSIMALFRVDFCGRGELADRQQKLAQMLSRLQKLSEGELYQYFPEPVLWLVPNLHRLLFLHHFSL